MQQPGAAEPRPERTPWGPWASLGLTYIAAVLPSIALAAPMASVSIGRMLKPESTANDLAANTMTQVLRVAGPILTVGLLMLFVRGRRGWTIDQYLALEPVRTGTVIWWTLGGMALQQVVLLAFELAGHNMFPAMIPVPYAPPWVLVLYLGCMTLVNMAAEESLIRGFLQRGLENTKLSAVTIAFITAGIWTYMRFPGSLSIGMYYLGLGVMLSLVRSKTQSLWPCLAIQAVGGVSLVVRGVWHLTLG